MSKTYTVKQVAQALDFSTNTVYKYLDEGKIKATRLGKEGRFRIPEKEVIRLLGLKGENPQIAPALQESKGTPSVIARSAKGGPWQSDLEIASSQTPRNDDGEGYEEKLSLLTKVSNPDLFDWFLALTAIFLGIAFFLFPVSSQYISFEPYRMQLLALKIFLIALGIVLMATDVFWPAKRMHNHLLNRLPLSLVFAGLTYIFYQASEQWTASYFGVLAFFSILPVVWTKGSYLKFMAFVYLLVVVSGWIWANNPQPFFFADIRDFVYTNPQLFKVMLVAISTIFAAISCFAYFRFPPLLLPLSWFVSGLFFLLSISFISDQAWNKAVVALMIGSFGLIFPFYQELGTLAKFSRKDVLISFSWLVLILAVGVAVIFYTQTTFKNFVLKESQKRVQTASKLVESFVEESIKYNNTIATDPALVEMLSAKATDKEKLEEFVKAKYQGASSLRRVAIINSKGDVIASYPVGEVGTTAVNIADLEHFQQSIGQKRTVISKLIESRIGGGYTIVIASPVLGSKGEVLGMVGGGIDTSQLQDKLTSIEFGKTGFFSLADNKRVIFIHKDGDLTGTEVKVNSSLIKAVEGRTGETVDYSEQRELSLQAFAHIPAVGWGIVAQQPISEALRESSFISFTIFLITIFSGVGTLLVTMYLKKRQL